MIYEENLKRGLYTADSKVAIQFLKSFKFCFCILPGTTDICLAISKSVSVPMPLDPNWDEWRSTVTPQQTRAAPYQIFADTWQDLHRAVRWSSSVTPQDFLTCTHILLHVSSMCTAGSLVVWKSVGAEKKGSAAFHRCMTLSNTQRLALNERLPSNLH